MCPGTSRGRSLIKKGSKGFHERDGRTTRLTPKAVSAVPIKVAAVMVSPNKTHAMMAVVGGTRYMRLVTEAAAPR